jgi:PAS domain S-box-containing protein
MPTPSGTNHHSILIVDDSSLLRGRLAELIRELPAIRIAGQASTGSQALDLLEATQTDSVILDIFLPDISGIEVLRRIKARRQATVVIMLTNAAGPEFWFLCQENGADFFLDKSFGLSQLAIVLRGLMQAGASATSPSSGFAMPRKIRTETEASDLSQGAAAYRKYIQASAPMLMCGTAPDGTARFVSPAISRVAGYEPEELIGRDLWRTLHPDVDDRQIARLLNILRRGDIHDCEMTLTTKSGERRVISWNSMNRYGERGELIEVVGVGADITERARMEERLHAERQRLNAIVESTSDAVYVKDSEGRYLLFNAAAGRVVGKEPAEVIGRDDTFIFSPEEARAVMEGDRRVLATGRPLAYEERVTTPDGVLRTFSSTKGPLFDQQGRISGLFGVARDLTERTRAEEEARHSEQRFRRLADTVPVLIWEADTTKNCVWFNAGWLAFTGRTQEQECGNGWTEGVHPEDYERCLQIYVRAFDRREPFEMEYRLRRHDGTYRRILDRGQPQFDAGGAFTGYMGVCIDVQEKHDAAEAVRQSEERWNYAFEGSGDGVWDWDVGTNKVYFSPRWKEMIGYAENEVGDSLEEWSSRVHPHDLPQAMAEVQRHFRGETPLYMNEHRIRCKDGSYKWILDRGKVVKRKTDGTPLRVVGTHADITERRRAEEGSARLAERLQVATDSAGLGVWEWDIDAGRMLWDDRMFTLYGRDRSNFSCTYEGWLECVYEEDRTRCDEAIRAAVAGGAAYHSEFRIKWPGGVIRWIKAHGALVWNSDKVPVRMTGVNYDITIQKETEEAIRVQRQRLAMILDSAMDAVVSVDAAQQVVVFNAAAEAMFGCSEEEALGQPLNRFVPERFRHEHGAQVAQFGEGPGNVRKMGGDRKVFALRANGEEFPVEATISRVRNGASLLFTVMLRDISARVQAEARQAQLEAQLQQAKQLEALGTLAGGVAHDFNNLLTAIIGFSQMTLRALDQDHPATRFSKEVLKAGERGATLSEQILLFSRRGVSEPVLIPINRTIEQFMHSVERLLGEDIAVQMNLDQAVPSVRMGTGQIEQILMNLLVNARDAMEGCGKITITTALEAQEHPIGTQGDRPVSGECVVVRVSDTGHGMDEQTKSRVFEPFFTTKGIGKGTGLGLSVVYGIVQQVGGSIELESTLGAGTTFTIRFPAVFETSDSAQGQADATVSSTAEVLLRTVLIVDDDPAVRSVSRGALEAIGCRVLEAANGDEALRLCQAFEGQPIDLLLTDVLMPGIRGPELAEQIQVMRPGMKVLYMSGYTEDSAISDVLARDQAVFLKKPFRLERLVDKVREVMARSVRGAESHADAEKIRPRILVVDDDEQVCALLKAILEEEGCNVNVATSAQIALKELNEQLVDVVITDILMPDKDGIELLRDFRRTGIRAPVIAMSGGGALEGHVYLDLARAFGATKILYKPLKVEAVLDTVRSVLKSVRERGS